MAASHTDVQSYSLGCANMHPIDIRIVPVLSPVESLWVYRPRTCPVIGSPPSWFCRNQTFICFSV